MERACRLADRAGVVGHRSQVAHRPQPSLVQLLRRHRSFLPGWRVIVLSNSRLRAKTKARVAGAARAFGSHEIVEDQDVTATSATRPKSRVATRASVQQQDVGSCIRTPTAMPKSPPSVKAQPVPVCEPGVIVTVTVASAAIA